MEEVLLKTVPIYSTEAGRCGCFLSLAYLFIYLLFTCNVKIMDRVTFNNPRRAFFPFDKFQISV